MFRVNRSTTFPPYETRQFLPILRRLASGWHLAGMALLGTGCTQLSPTGILAEPPAAITRASGAELLPIKAVASLQPASTAEDPKTSAEPVAAKTLAINLDTVLRLAEGQNTQIALARARVEEAFATKDLAATSWLPSLNIGTSYLRHEGGIANEDGTITRSSFSTLFAGLEINGRLDLREAVYQQVQAERQLWQQKGELSRITSETLLEAAGTYLDLLAARTGEAIALSVQKDLEELLARAKELFAAEPGTEVQLASVQTQLVALKQQLVTLRDQAAAASTKLAYLLGLDPHVTLMPVDKSLVPLELVDVSGPVDDLVARALATGPGVHEMEGLLALIHESIGRSKGLGRYLPILELRMAEGGFGTGPGDQQLWDNRWDLGLQARWNLMDLVTAHDRQHVLQTKTVQAHLAYDDLRGKLAAGVRVSRDAIVSNREQIRLAEEQIREARRTHQLSHRRWKNNVPNSTAGDVLLALQTVATAQTSYVKAIHAYDRAQLQLMMLLGTANGPAPADGNCPKPTERSQ
jgi:outer membrane protein TolC